MSFEIYLQKSNRGSGKYSDSDDMSSDSEDDSAFSSENKENKKGTSKQKSFARSSSSSDSFSSDESSSEPVKKRKPKNKATGSAKKSGKNQQYKSNNVIVSSSEESSDSSDDSFYLETQKCKKKMSQSKVINKKKVTKSVESNSSSSESDSDHSKPKTINNKKLSPTKTNAKTKTAVEAKKKTFKKPVKKTIASSSSSLSESSQDSDSALKNSTPKPAKKKTALEKLESLYTNSCSSSGSSSDSIVSPSEKKKVSPTKLKPLISDDDEKYFGNKAKVFQNKPIKASTAKRKVMVSSTSSSSNSSSHSASDSDSNVESSNRKTLKSISRSGNKSICEVNTKSSCQKSGSQLKDKKKYNKLMSGKKFQEVQQDKKSNNPSPVRKHFTKEGSKSEIKLKLENSKEDGIKSTKQSKVSSKISPESSLKRKFEGGSKTETKENLFESDSFLDITEQEKGREEKATKMQSIFFKPNANDAFDNIEEQNDDDDSSSSSENEDQLDEYTPRKNRLPKTPDIENSTEKSIVQSKLFDTSDSESEVKLKIPDKILQEEDSQDFDEIPRTPDIEISPEKGLNIFNVQNSNDTISKPDFRSQECKQDKVKKQKSELPVSEPVQNTVVETEKAVKSLEKLWEEPVAPTIVETGIVANVEVQSESVEEKTEDKVDMVAEDEVANAILSICGVPLDENGTVAVVSSDELERLTAEGGHENQVVYQIQDQSEAQEAVATLVFESEDVFQDAKEADTYTVTYTENELLVPTKPEEPLKPQYDQVFAVDTTSGSVAVVGCSDDNSHKVVEIVENDEIKIENSGNFASTSEQEVKNDSENAVTPIGTTEQNKEIPSDGPIVAERSEAKLENVDRSLSKESSTQPSQTNMTPEKALSEKESKDVNVNLNIQENHLSQSATKDVKIEHSSVKGAQDKNLTGSKLASNVTATPESKLMKQQNPKVLKSPESKEVKPSKYITELLSNPNKIQEIIDGGGKPKGTVKPLVEDVLPQIPSFERLSSLPGKSESLMLSNPLTTSPSYFTQQKDEFPCYVTPSFNLVQKDNLQKQKVSAPSSMLNPVEHKIQSVENISMFDSNFKPKPYGYENTFKNVVKPSKPTNMMYDIPQMPKPDIGLQKLHMPVISESKIKTPVSDFPLPNMVNTNVHCQKPPQLPTLSSRQSKPVNVSHFGQPVRSSSGENYSENNTKNSIQRIQNLVASVADKTKQDDPNPFDTFRKIEVLKEQIIPDKSPEVKEIDIAGKSEIEKESDPISKPDSLAVEAKENEDACDKLDFHKEGKTDLKTYDSRNMYNMFNSPEVDDTYVSTPLPESDTDKEKEEEEQKDNIVYEKEPEKEAIPIEELNDFEDEEDLPDLIIDESPVSHKDSPQADEETAVEQFTKTEATKEDTIDDSKKLPENQMLQMNSSSSKVDTKNSGNISGISKSNEIEEVSLKEDEELEVGVLLIVEDETQTQPTFNLTPSSKTLPATPKSKRKPGSRRNKKASTSLAVNNINSDMHSLTTPVPNITIKTIVKPDNITNDINTIRSPVTRRKAKQEDSSVANVSAPATRNRAGNLESGEKFSSRGRKIIPKERGDEVTMISRKGRRNLSTNSNSNDDKLTKKAEESGDTSNEPFTMVIQTGKKKTWPLRNRKEDSIAQDTRDKKDPRINDTDIDKSTEPTKECGPIKMTFRKTQSRGRKATIQTTTTVEVSSEQETHTNVVSDANNKAGTPAEAPAPAEENVRTRRSRRTNKGKKSVNSAKSRTRSDGSISPRSKSSEATSPKELSKSYVKLEKLNIEQSAAKKDDDDQKDLYEWNDEEEKPLLEYKVARENRKRKGNDSTESPQKTEVDVVEPKRTKKAKAAAELRKEARDQKKDKNAKVEERKVEPIKIIPPKPDPIPEKKDPPPEPRKPDMADILQEQRGHLPLKLAMKWESQEAARKEREAKEAAEKAAAEKAAQEAQKLEEEKNKPGIVSDHLDKVIDEVARGNFEKSEEARIIDKKRGRFNREEQFSPIVKELPKPELTSYSVTSVSTTVASSSTAATYTSQGRILSHGKSNF